jgi:uncharacterized glyoxalase superfamily protein PhnB
MVNQSGKIVNRSMPPGTIILELVYDNVSTAVTWLCHTFGFKERLRIGHHRSQLLLGDASIVVMAQHGTPTAAIEPERTHSVMIQVADVDQHYQHVKQCGARIINPPADFPYGERQYTVEDLGGHRWTFSQSIADVEPREWGGILLTET